MPRVTEQALTDLFDHSFQKANRFQAKQQYPKASFFWHQCLQIKPNDKIVFQKYLISLEKENKVNVVVGMFPSMYSLFGKQLQLHNYFNLLQKLLANDQISIAKSSLQQLLYFARNQTSELPTIIDKYCFLYLFSGEIEQGFQVILKYEKIMQQYKDQVTNFQEFFNSLKSLFIFHIGKYSQCCTYIQKNMENRLDYKYITFEYEKGFLSRCQILLGNYDYSLKISNEIIEYLKNNQMEDQLFKFYSLKSLSLYKLGNVKQALDEMENAIKHKEDDSFSQIKWCLLNILVCQSIKEKEFFALIRQKLTQALKIMNEESSADKYIRSEFSQYFPNPKTFLKLKEHIQFLIRVLKEQNIQKFEIKELKQIVDYISQFFIEGMLNCQITHQKLLLKQQILISQLSIL